MLLTGSELLRYCSGVWGRKAPSGARGGPRGFDLGSSLRGCGGGKPPRLWCWGCRWGWGWGCSWPQDFGRGARPWGGLRGCPPTRCWQHRRATQGGNHASLPAHINFFLRGGYGGAWNGAQAEEARARNGSRFRHRSGRALPEPERSGTRRSALQKKEHGFHLVLDGASGASTIASPRSSTFLTSSAPARRWVFEQVLQQSLRVCHPFECSWEIVGACCRPASLDGEEEFQLHLLHAQFAERV